jgi:hypothetical protein
MVVTSSIGIFHVVILVIFEVPSVPDVIADEYGASPEE